MQQNQNNNIKIRDLRHKEKFVIDDLYLNGYARHCGNMATLVYLSLCRHANFKEQTCFPSKKLMAEELNISERSVYTGIRELEKWGIIKISHQGRKPNGSYKVLIYTLLDKSQWKSLPSANDTVGKNKHEPSANNVTNRKQYMPNKDTNSKDTNNNVAVKPQEEFNSNNFIQKWIESNQRHIKIIGFFASHKQVVFENKDQANSFLKRHLRASNNLVGYTDKKIITTMEHLNKNADYKWTLETVGKFIDEMPAIQKKSKDDMTSEEIVEAYQEKKL